MDKQAMRFGSAFVNRYPNYDPAKRPEDLFESDY